jgi:hypothetical protein
MPAKLNAATLEFKVQGRKKSNSHDIYINLL